MKSVTEVCTPRADILAGKHSDAIYAADLSLVRDGKAPSVYQSPSEFFRNTYPTIGLKTTISEVFARLAGKSEGSPVIKLETSLGGGKTHALISLFHIAKGGSATPGANEYVAGLNFKPVKVVALIGTELSVVRQEGRPLTLWGHIGQELKGKEGYALMKGADEQMSSPGEEALRTLFGDEKCIILMDEMAIYLAKAATLGTGESNLARQSAIFLQELGNVASSISNVVMVITSLDKDSVFREGTELMERYLDTDVKKSRAQEAINDADKVLPRVMKTLTPTKGEEFSAVVLRRLFESIDPVGRKETCKEYSEMLRAPSNVDYLPAHVHNIGYLTNLEESYPFHPELINILRTKTSSIPNFNKTRGVLRLLSKVVKNTWENGRDVHLIHPYAVDMRRQEFVEEIVSRLDRGEFQAAIASDISNETQQPRAALVDKDYHEPLGTRICNVIFLHSITGARGSEASFGANEAEVHLSIARPGFDLKRSEDALKALENKCFYLARQGSNFSFNSEPNLNKIIEMAKDNVEQTRVVGELNDRIRSIYGSKNYFTPVFFANEPSNVSDDTERPKLVLMHFRDCVVKARSNTVPSEVRNIYTKAGTQGAARIYGNNLFFLVAEAEEVEEMEMRGREYLAYSQLCRDADGGATYLSALTQGQRDKLKTLRKEGDLYLSIAVMVAHKHVFLPTEQGDLEAVGSARNLRPMVMRVSDTEARSTAEAKKGMEGALVKFLRDAGSARTSDDNPLSPEFIIEEIWDKKKESYAAADFRKLFYRRPVCGLVLTDELIKASLKKGVEEGRWVVVSSGELYEKANSTLLYAGLTDEVEIVRVGTEKHRNVLALFYCEGCKKRKKDCKCHEIIDDGEKVKKCPKCGMEEISCTCHRRREIKVDRVKMERAASDLKMRAADAKVEKIASIRIKCESRNALVKMMMAWPQFGKVDITCNIAFSINNRHTGGNDLSVKYQGDKAGLEALRQVVINYDGKQAFSSHDLYLDLKYPDGIDVNEICDLLGKKVAEYTAEELFTISMQPKEN